MVSCDCLVVIFLQNHMLKFVIFIITDFMSAELSETY